MKRPTNTALVDAYPMPEFMTATEAMAFLDLTRSPFYDHVRHGVIPRRPDGKFDGHEILKAYLGHLRAAAEARGGSAGEQLSIERAKLAREQADKVEMDNAHRRAELITADEAIEAYSADLSELRAGLLAIPSKVGQECATMTPAEISQFVAQAIDDAFIAMRSAEDVVETVKAAQMGDAEGRA